MSDIARRAGVGMSAIYLRFGSRNAMLHAFADEANAVYDRALDDVEQALAADREPRGILARFIADITASGVHRLGLAIAGTFERTAADIAESTRLRDRGRRFIAELHGRGVLRPGATWEDLGKSIEALSSIDGADAPRSQALRERMTDILVTGLTSGGEPLLGPAADAADFRENRPPDADPGRGPSRGR